MSFIWLVMLFYSTVYT